MVFAKHDWFHKAPLNIFCDIDSLLNATSGLCTQYGNNGSFTFALDADSMAMGHPGDVLAVHATLTNVSATDNVVMDIAKLNINVPNGWQTALCADICYATSTTQTQIILGPGQVQPFTFYFYTDAIPAAGDVRVGFRNNPHPNNFYGQRFYGSTLATGLQGEATAGGVQLYPNPILDRFSLHAEEGIREVAWHDLTGRLLRREEVDPPSNTAALDAAVPPGIYLLVVNGDRGHALKAMVR